MVLDSNTLLPMHELTEEGKREYRRLLDIYADLIIWRHEHPFLYMIELLRECLSD